MTVTVSPKNATAKVGDTKQFSATVQGITGGTVTWTSSQPKKVSIDANSGLATVESTAKATDSVAITATVVGHPEATATAILTVTA